MIRRLGALGLAIAVLTVVVVVSIAVGSVTVPFAQVLEALGGARTSEAHFIVSGMRVPRTVSGLVAGSCLGVAGVLLQGATRNPIASPALLGITAGGGFAVVVGVAFLGLPAGAAVWVAFVGGAAAAALALGLASTGREGLSPVRLVLSGAIVSSLLGAWTAGLLAIDQRTADDVRHWLAGSLAGRDVAAVGPLLPVVVAGLLGAWLLAGQLDALALGDETAVGLGQHPARTRLVAAGIAVLLSAVAVALAGPIAFVGLAVPHLARALVGAAHRPVLLLSMLLGPAMLLGADVVGRVVARPSEVQAGVLTALLGAPLLVRLAVRVKSPA
ncbi:MAG: iron ABC transporter permease [Actinobacteria bacterium]|nr:iron ABC transporter permease [Actinomycetota bacterium]